MQTHTCTQRQAAAEAQLGQKWRAKREEEEGEQRRKEQAGREDEPVGGPRRGVGLRSDPEHSPAGAAGGESTRSLHPTLEVSGAGGRLSGAGSRSDCGMLRLPCSQPLHNHLDRRQESPWVRGAQRGGGEGCEGRGACKFVFVHVVTHTHC